MKKLLFLFIFAISCGKSTHQTKTIISLAALTNHSQFSNGLILYAYHRETKKSIAKILSSTSDQLILANGLWDISVMGWTPDQTNQSNFEGEILCEVKENIQLGGDDVRLNFTLSSRGCLHPLIASSENQTRKNNKLKKVRFMSCANFEALFEDEMATQVNQDDFVAADGAVNLYLFGHYLKNGLQITESQIHCDTEMSGQAKSFKVKIDDKNSTLSSRCFNTTEETLFNLADTNLRLPLGEFYTPTRAPTLQLPIIVEAYQKKDCLDEKVSYDFSYGLAGRDQLSSNSYFARGFLFPWSLVWSEEAVGNGKINYSHPGVTQDGDYITLMLSNPAVLPGEGDGSDNSNQGGQCSMAENDSELPMISQDGFSYLICNQRHLEALGNYHFAFSAIEENKIFLIAQDITLNDDFETITLPREGLLLHGAAPFWASPFLKPFKRIINLKKPLFNNLNDAFLSNFIIGSDSLTLVEENTADSFGLLARISSNSRLSNIHIENYLIKKTNTTVDTFLGAFVGIAQSGTSISWDFLKTENVAIYQQGEIGGVGGLGGIAGIFNLFHHGALNLSYNKIGIHLIGKSYLGGLLGKVDFASGCSSCNLHIGDSEVNLEIKNYGTGVNQLNLPTLINKVGGFIALTSGNSNSSVHIEHSHAQINQILPGAHTLDFFGGAIGYVNLTSLHTLDSVSVEILGSQRGANALGGIIADPNIILMNSWFKGGQYHFTNPSPGLTFNFEGESYSYLTGVDLKCNDQGWISGGVLSCPGAAKASLFGSIPTSNNFPLQPGNRVRPYEINNSDKWNLLNSEVTYFGSKSFLLKTDLINPEPLAATFLGSIRTSCRLSGKPFDECEPYQFKNTTPETLFPNLDEAQLGFFDQPLLFENNGIVIPFSSEHFSFYNNDMTQK